METFPTILVLAATVVLAFSSVSSASTQTDDLVQAGDLFNASIEQKPVKKTGRYWDLAIVGSGFFPLQDSKTGETLYTRLGHFELDHDGYVVLSAHPDLRLLMQIGAKPAPLNLLKLTRSSRALMVGLAIDKDDEAGAVSGIYTSGETVQVGKLVLAKFFNDGKLSAVAPHVYKVEAAALPSLLASPMEKGLGRIVNSSLEQL